MTRVYSIVLVESDAQITDDVKRGLALVNIPLTVAPTIEDARRLLSEVRPTMVLLRGTLSGQRTESFAAELSTETLGNVPFAVLVSEREEASFAALLANCLGPIRIPVAFPAFTYLIQDLLIRASVNAPGYETRRPEPTPTESVPVAAVSSEEQDAAQQMELDRKFYVVHAIHHHVLRELEYSDTFREARFSELPKLVAEATRLVCEGFTGPRGGSQ